MNLRAENLIFHAVLIGAVTAAMVLCMVYPFLPGAYDSLAAGISIMAQVSGVSGLLLVPVSVLWFAYEGWRYRRIRRNHPVGGGFYFALVSLIAATLVAAVVSIAGAATTGVSVGVLVFSLWTYGLSRLAPRLTALKRTDRLTFNAVPLYMICIPPALLLTQTMIDAPLTQASRDYAIAMSAELISDLEAYYADNGHYPNSLVATWPDYSPSVVGIDQYHYAIQGDAYNLVFHQPRFLLDDFGAREFVVYNSLNQHTMVSHASWILLLSPGTLRATPGWYTVRSTTTPHWKYFLFD